MAEMAEEEEMAEEAAVLNFGNQIQVRGFLCLMKPESNMEAPGKPRLSVQIYGS